MKNLKSSKRVVFSGESKFMIKNKICAFYRIY